MTWLFPLVLITAPVTGCSDRTGIDRAGIDPRARTPLASVGSAAAGPASDSAAPGGPTGLNCGQAAAPAVDEVLGRYVVRAAEKYRGGLTTPGQAEARVGGEVALTAELFSIDGREWHQPRYSLECLDVSHAEGEVPTGRQRMPGPFHGYGTGRAVVWELTVEAGDPDVPLATFEVVPDGEGVELWRLYDGWVYVLAAR